jgi:WD40 repeat protein
MPDVITIGKRLIASIRSLRSRSAGLYSESLAHQRIAYASKPYSLDEQVGAEICRRCGPYRTDRSEGAGVLRGHQEALASAVFSPNGKWIITASNDQMARLWDAETGKEIMILRGHAGQVLSAAFWPDGTQVVTASTDKTARAQSLIARG